MRTLFRPILCILILHCCILPIYASVQLGMGLGHSIHHIKIEEHEESVRLASRPLHATIETSLTGKTRIAFDVSYQTIDEAWVGELTTLRGYEAAGLGSRWLLPVFKTNITSISIGPEFGLWYARYSNTPLAFAYAIAGVFGEVEINVGNLIKQLSNQESFSLPLKLKLQVPYTVAFRKDISFQSTVSIRVGLLAGIS